MFPSVCVLPSWGHAHQGEAFRGLPPHLFVALSLHSKGDQVSIVPCARPPEEMSDA